MGILLALTISGTALVHFTTSNARTAEYSSVETNARHLAEAGVNYASSVLWNAADPTSPSAVPSGTVPFEDGDVTYSGTLTGTTWTLTGTATVENPTGGDDIVETVSTQVAIVAGASGGDGSPWRYLFAAGDYDIPLPTGGGGSNSSKGYSSDGCDDSSSDAFGNPISSNSGSTDSCGGQPVNCTVEVKNEAPVGNPLYVRGILCLDNEAVVTGSTVEVTGRVDLLNDASIGTDDDPIDEIHAFAGCSYNGGPLNNPCGIVDQVYASQSDAAVPSLRKPSVDLAYWYANAKPGPTTSCTSGSFPGGFDNDAFWNESLSDVYLTPTSAYNCRVTDASGNLLGQLTWVPGTGTLTVNGTIFFDGNVKIERSAVYEGRGTIYASGIIEVSGDSELCGAAGCSTDWDPEVNLLALVAGSSSATWGIELKDRALFQGALYAVTGLHLSGRSEFWGSAVVNRALIENRAETYGVPIETLLPGMPQDPLSPTVTTLAAVPGSYTVS